MANNASGQLIAHNAVIQLNTDVDNLWYFRPPRGQGGHEAAVVRLYPCESAPYFIKILDQRPDSVEIARGWASLRTAEKKVKHVLDQSKVEQAKAEARGGWPEYFGLNASVYLDHEEAASGRHYPVIILREPDEDSEVDGMLTAVTLETGPSASFSTREARDSWMRTTLYRQGDVYHFLILTVTSHRSAISIFHRSIDGKTLVETDYHLSDTRTVIRRTARIVDEDWLEGEPETLAEEEAPESEEDPKDFSIQTIEGIDINGALGLLMGAGIDTVGKLADSDPQTVKTATGLKIGTVKNLRKKAEEFLTTHSN